MFVNFTYILSIGRYFFDLNKKKTMFRRLGLMLLCEMDLIYICNIFVELMFIQTTFQQQIVKLELF